MGVLAPRVATHRTLCTGIGPDLLRPKIYVFSENITFHIEGIKNWTWTTNKITSGKGIYFKKYTFKVVLYLGKSW